MTSEPPAPRQLAWEAVRSGHRGASDRDVVPPVSRSVPRSCHLGRVVFLLLRRLLSILCPFLSSS